MGFGNVRWLTGKGEFEDFRQVDSYNRLSFPDQGSLQDGALIYPFSSKYDLLVSTDGGSSYSELSTPLDIEEFQNSSMMHLSTSIRWRTPKGEFPELKSIVVRLVNREEQTISDEKTLTYLTDDFSDLPIVSISVPEDDLFSELNGLMVYGSSSWSDSIFYTEWWFRAANFSQRGVKWEREVNLKYFDEGELMLDQDCGLRISGNATRYFPQKSMRFVARRGYGLPTFDFPFWDHGIDEANSFVLRNSGNDNMKTMFADLLIHRLCRDREVIVSEGKPVQVFLNGNYWGLYNMRERIDEKYVSEKTGWKKKNITILENGDGFLKDGLQEEKDKFDSLLIELEAKQSLSDKELVKLEEEIDIISFADFIVIETFFANQDWPNNNVAWCNKKGKQWKWILTDLDYSMAYPGADNVQTNLFDKLNSGNSHTARLYKILMSSESFKALFIERAETFVNIDLDAQRLENEYNSLYDIYESQIELQIRRWRSIPSIENWKANSVANFDFIRTRKQIYLEQLRNL